MKNKKTRISAHEVNRFVYCPYQWYYGRTYGQKTLKEKYQVQKRKIGHVESNFKRGLHFHEEYYKHYRMKRSLEVGILLIFIALLIGSLIGWLM